MRKLLIVAEMRALEKQVHLGEISYSRMIEIINDKADTLLSDKLLLAYCEIDELTKVIDGYKSDSEELITTKELLLDLTISDKKFYDKQEQRIINLSEKLLISEKSEKFYKDRAKELSDILYLAESENAELTKEVERLRKGLPSIDESGAIAVSVSSKVEPSLSAQEEAMFIAGFQECVKYLSMLGKGN